MATGKIAVPKRLYFFQRESGCHCISKQPVRGVNDLSRALLNLHSRSLCIFKCITLTWYCPRVKVIKQIGHFLLTSWYARKLKYRLGPIASCAITLDHTGSILWNVVNLLCFGNPITFPVLWWFPTKCRIMHPFTAHNSIVIALHLPKNGYFLRPEQIRLTPIFHLVLYSKLQKQWVLRRGQITNYICPAISWFHQTVQPSRTESQNIHNISKVVNW